MAVHAGWSYNKLAQKWRLPKLTSVGWNNSYQYGHSMRKGMLEDLSASGDILQKSARGGQRKNFLGNFEEIKGLKVWRLAKDQELWNQMVRQTPSQWWQLQRERVLPMLQALRRYMSYPIETSTWYQSAIDKISNRKCLRCLKINREAWEGALIVLGTNPCGGLRKPHKTDAEAT